MEEIRIYISITVAKDISVPLREREESVFYVIGEEFGISVFPYITLTKAR
jgi:hypothetical protein